MGQRDKQIPPQRAGVQELRGHGHRGSQPKMAWDGQGPWQTAQQKQGGITGVRSGP